MNKNKGIYVMKNEDRPEVKIGWSGDIEGRRKRLSQESSAMTKYETYYVYMTKEKTKLDEKLHHLIDLINKDLRLQPNREFYKLTVEKAGNILKLIAETTETKDRLIDYTKTIKQRHRKQNNTFKKLKIDIGSKLQFGNKANIVCKVVNEENRVKYKNKEYSISELATMLVREKMGYGNKSYVNGWNYFKYKGQFLSEMEK